MNSRRSTALLIVLGCLAMALGAAWKLGQPSPDDSEVTVEPVWFDKPLILPGELPFPPSSDMHAVLSVLQRSIRARSWEEYAACYTSATVPTLSYSNKDGITRFGRAGWEMATERHRQQFTVLGAILIAAKGQRYAFFYVIPSAITKLEPGQKMILTFVAVKDASRGWLLDRTLIDRSTLHLLSLDRPLDYVCYGKKQEFARLIPQIKDSYRREFIDGQSGFYHFPANPQESGWIEWYPKEPKSAGGQPKGDSPLRAAWKLGQPSPDDSEVTVEPVWFDKPLLLPGELPFPPSSDIHAVLSVLQRSRDARSWEEYAACHTSATVPTLSFSNNDGITRFGRAGWEMARPTREKHRNYKITVLGAILIAAKGHRYVFFYVIPSAITKLEPGQKMILTFVAVKDASRGWLLDRTLIDRSTLHLLSLDRPLDYICYGKKQEFARLIPQIKDSYRREFIDGQSGFYHYPANPQESGWIEWYPKEPKSAGGQPKGDSP